MPCIELGTVILHNPVPEPSDICQFVTKLAIEEMAIWPINNLERIHLKPSAAIGLVRIHFCWKSCKPCANEFAALHHKDQFWPFSSASLWIGKSKPEREITSSIQCSVLHPPTQNVKTDEKGFSKRLPIEYFLGPFGLLGAVEIENPLQLQ